MIKGVSFMFSVSYRSP